MAACDGISFNTLAKSPSFEQLFRMAGCSGKPSSGHGVRDCMMEYYSSAKSKIIVLLKSLLGKGNKLSITLDEWTSTANRRYLNVNVHGSAGNSYNLGLARLSGSITSEVCMEVISKKLEDFGISFETDITCITTDGAAVMAKLGRISLKLQQLCMAHGIHLAVIEAIYTHDQKGVESNCDTNEEDEAEDDLDSPFFLDEQDCPPENLEPSIYEIVGKVRRTVKIFKKSPLKEEVLKKYTQAVHGQAFGLLLDVKTRWNSLLTMLERFVLLKNEIQKALIDIREVVYFTDDEFNQMNELIRVLQPVKLVVEALCKRDATLISCDIVLQFVMTRIKEGDSDIATKVYESIKKRILERRTYLSEVISYLNYGKLHSCTSPGQEYFNYISRSQLTNHIKTLAELNCDNTSLIDASDSETQYSEEILNSTSSGASVQSLELELYSAIRFAHSIGSRKRNHNPNQSLLATIRKEMTLFECGGSRGKNLENVYQMLMSIPPTSVESERVFSSAAYLCSKIRSRLGDSTLDALVFLRSHFRCN